MIIDEHIHVRINVILTVLYCRGQCSVKRRAAVWVYNGGGGGVSTGLRSLLQGREGVLGEYWHVRGMAGAKTVATLRKKKSAADTCPGVRDIIMTRDACCRFLIHFCVRNVLYIYVGLHSGARHGEQQGPIDV